MAFVFDSASMAEFEKQRKKFPDGENGNQSMVIPALWICQKQNGWISPEAVDYVAEITGTARLHVWSVATFYTMFFKEPVGKNVLQFCTNISCGLNGGEELMHHACGRLGIKEGETTKDGMFTVLAAECLGACGAGPVVQAGDEYHEHMTVEKLDELIDKLIK